MNTSKHKTPYKRDHAAEYRNRKPHKGSPLDPVYSKRSRDRTKLIADQAATILELRAQIEALKRRPSGEAAQ